MYHLSYIAVFFIKSDQFEMFQCVADSIFINSACLICAVLFDIAIGVAHGHADSGCFQHGEDRWDCLRMRNCFLSEWKDGPGEISSLWLGGAFCDDFPDSVSVFK